MCLASSSPPRRGHKPLRPEEVAADRHDWLAERFEETRGHLWAIAYRMLGSAAEADDAVQESWLRLNRSGESGVENLRRWLTTVVARVSLDLLRARKLRREEPLNEHVPELIVSREGGTDPEQEALLADSVGLALRVVLEKLAPAERVAFVLHDMFAMPFDEIAPIVGRSPAAARQLASRARRRVQGKAAVPTADHTHRPDVVDAFLVALRGGDFEGLIAVLDPDVVVRVDEAGRIWVHRERSAGRGTGPMSRSPFHRLPASPTDARRRRGGSCLGSRWTPVPGAQVHDHAWEDPQNRRDRRFHAPPSSRPDAPQQLTSQRTVGERRPPLAVRA